jgi:hypothetical protein
MGRIWCVISQEFSVCPIEDDKLASYAYWTVMMGLITVLMFEGMCYRRQLSFYSGIVHHNFSRVNISKQYPHHAPGCLSLSGGLRNSVDHMSPVRLGRGPDRANQARRPQ